MKTPEWILEGYDSKADWEKVKGIVSEKKIGKNFKVRECPKCKGDDIAIVLSGSDSEESTNTGRVWECRECKWKGSKINERELTEEEFMKYLDEKGEEVA